MTTEAATGGMQWELGGASVALDVDPAAVPPALLRVWGRICQGLDELEPAQWQHPTRCSEWQVVDIVNHLADTCSWVVDVIDSAAEGRRSTIFDGFEPRGVPKRLTDAADRDPAAARRRLDGAIAAVTARVAIHDPASLTDVLLLTPLGEQPAPAGLLHLTWDTWLHERDLFLPLGRRTPVERDEVRMVALYTLRMEGFIAMLFKREVHTALVLHGALDDTLRLDLSGKRLRAGAGTAEDAAHVLQGEAATVVDALCGRGELGAALDGAEEARASLGGLRSLLAGA
jgi:uncharacterized protein (TIGR03083 family)